MTEYEPNPSQTDDDGNPLLCWPRSAIKAGTRVQAKVLLHRVPKGQRGTIWLVLKIGCRILWDSTYEQAYRLETIPLAHIAPDRSGRRPSGKAVRKLREFRRETRAWEEALEVNFPAPPEKKT